ncbi:MAG: hypothetical protein Phyf2KO_26140 [Phycisphaerales bacterium]
MWLLQFAVVLGHGISGPAANDEQEFHLPTIRHFAEQMPTPDLESYNVATTPGYHLLLAVAANLGAESDTALRLIGGQFAVLLAALMACWIGKRIEWPFAVVLSLPAFVSIYTFAPMVLALPEAAAWLGVLAMLVIGLRRVVRKEWFVVAGVVLVGLVCIRQIHIWAAVPVWLSAWLGSQQEREPVRLVPRPNELELNERLPFSVFALLCTLPAFGILVWFFWLWQGPVPPSFQTSEAASEIRGAAVHSGGNIASPAMVLALFGLFAPLFIAGLIPAILRKLGERPAVVWFVLVSGALSFLIAVVPETSFSVSDGRWTGLWNVVGKLPTIGERSPVILGLATAGGIQLACLLLVIRSRDRLIIAGTLLAFTVAQTANFQSWARYLLPMVLFTLVMLTTLALQVLPARRVTHLIGPSLLAIGFGYGTVMRLLET